MAQQNVVINGTITLQGLLVEGVTIGAQRIAGSLLLQLPNSQPQVNQFLLAESVTGNTVILGWAYSDKAFPQGVSSIGLALPSIFNISGSPVTTTGVLTGELTNQNANLLFAGPVSGTATPTFRALVATDIPQLGATMGQALEWNGTVWAPSTFSGVVSFNSRNGSVSPQPGDYTVAQITGAAPLASPTFTGIVALPAGTYAISVSGNATSITGSITQSQVTGLITALGLLAPLISPTIVSPTFTGIPVGPTATGGTNTTQLATTAFVAAAVGASAVGLSDPGANGVIKRVSFGITAIALAADVITTLGYTPANDTLVTHLAGSETITGNKTFTGTVVLPNATYAINISGNAAGLSASIAESQVTNLVANLAAKMVNPMTTAGDLIIENSTPALARLGIGNPGQILTVVGGLPAWANAPAGAVFSVFGRSGTIVAANGDYTPTQIGLGSVTNDVQTKAAIVPNTVPTAGQILVGNTGGTAYAPVTISGDSTLSFTGAMTLATVNANVGAFTNANIIVNAKSLVTAASSGSVGTAFVQNIASNTTIGFSGAASTLVQITTGTGTISMTLPTAVGIGGRTVTAIKVDAGVGSAPFLTTASQTINGSLTMPSLINQWQSISITSNNVNWVITGMAN